MAFKQFIASHFITVLFMILIGLLSVFLLGLPQPLVAKIGYASFLLMLCAAYFVNDIRVKHSLSIVSCSVIILIGLVFRLDLELIEEIYLLIPFLYLILYPGAFWPVVVGGLLTSAYVSFYGENVWVDVFEDALEIIVISAFASVMTYFQQKSQRQMRHFRQESYTDYLTRLPNRKAFMRHLNHLRDQVLLHQSQQHFSLMIIDLDGFKKINDQLGHLMGDLVLKTVADRLQSLVTASHQGFRIGGDEFAFVVSDQLAAGRDISALAQDIISLCNQPYQLSDKKFVISASIGIARFPEEASEIEPLCTNADMAMYRAKASGKNTFSFCDAQLMASMVKKYELENDLKQAIQKGQLYLLYQPKVDLQTGQIVSAEALIRWAHPTYGLVNPAEFIAIAEQSNSIIEIGRWVIETACQQMMQWQDYRLDSIAVNVSSVQLNDAGFVSDVKEVLASSGCSAQMLELEQTESWIMDNPEENIAVLLALKDLGVKLALDDFGTAYSSLSQVSCLPMDILKIDKSFIDNCVTNKRDHMVVRTVIQLGHNLGMKLVAEGVETQAQRQLIQQEGCDMFQGYLFSKPVDAVQFEHLMKQQSDKKE